MLRIFLAMNPSHCMTTCISKHQDVPKECLVTLPCVECNKSAELSVSLLLIDVSLDP